MQQNNKILNDKVTNIIENISNDIPDILKNNKGAILGALIGYFLTNQPKAQSSVLGMIAGMIADDKKQDCEDKNE